jgi:hypothetical protein
MSDTDAGQIYRNAVLSEIAMLVDYIAANSAKKLADLQAKDPTTNNPLTPGELLEKLNEMQQKVANNSPGLLTAADLTWLQVVRDALNSLSSPASGLTVAYTALVTGRRRSRQSLSRETLAQVAYPGLIRQATWHRWAQRGFLVFAVIVTLGTVWESAKVALGKSLLQDLEGLRTQQVSIAQEKLRVEAVLDTPRQGAPKPSDLILTDGDTRLIALSAFSLCDRSDALADYLKRMIQNNDGAAAIPAKFDKKATKTPAVSEASAERDVCGRDSVLRTNFNIVHADLKKYREDWPVIAGGVFSAVDTVIRTVEDWACRPGHLTCANSPPLLDGQDDVEFVIAPALLVWGNYVLPVMFSLLGALIYVILEFYGKVRDSRLAPRDGSLCWIRVVLGLVTGACIGLLFSSAGVIPSSAPSNLASALTLSGSGIAFLAGFGVEGVFSMLQSLVSRVFVTDTAVK